MALVEPPPPFSKLNPLLTDTDSENGAESKDNDNEEDSQECSASKNHFPLYPLKRVHYTYVISGRKVRGGLNRS
jgi:hypothetical protein